jgi:hypothetical protein
MAAGVVVPLKEAFIRLLLQYFECRTVVPNNQLVPDEVGLCDCLRPVADLKFAKM